ncbi:rod shape-determining protein MreC [Cellvibrio sp. KB43]|uniref:Cell shape-determining protein MreC n=1 Tax=Cellvibrio polysaccharolyticus TaxID=2082724 RepID=A0A928YSW4_9GAMM|nr:rod shape-determining protein MreC [Cellvibrio polysaccharolyticus]
MKPLFTKGAAASSRAFFFILVMIGLIFTSLYTDWLQPVRATMKEAVAPFYVITDIPRQINEWRQNTFSSRSDLLIENEALRTELLIHQRKLQQMAALAAENVRLRQLMNATDMLQDKVLIAELIGVSPNPLSHTVWINRGHQQGVYEGQPLLDAFGLMGQVIEVQDNTSQVLLISDVTHALPVQVNRNGVRAIAEGTGDLNRLRLRHVSNTTDIRVGDLVVSSGLGERFPTGYPVGEVDSIIRDPGQPFATVIVRPMARLDRSRHVLLVFDSREAGH